MTEEFYFPLKREQLLEKPSDDRFYIEDISFFSEPSDIDDDLSSMLSSLLSSIQNDVLSLYQNGIFGSFYSICSQFQTVNPLNKKRILETFSKCLKAFANKIEDVFDENAIEQQKHNSLWRNCLKMYIFLTEWNTENCLVALKSQQKEIKKARRKVRVGTALATSSTNEEYTNANKKKTKRKGNVTASNSSNANSNNSGNLLYDSDDATSSNTSFKDIIINIVDSILNSITKISNSNIKVLFRSKIIDDDIITLLIKACFDCLEMSIEVKNLSSKDKIFDCLQCLITKFQANTNIQLILLKLTTKIVNLIYSQEQLVSSLSEFIAIALKGDSNMSKMAVDIIHEVSKTVFEDTTMDSQGLKNVGSFLIFLSEKSAKTIYNNITSLIHLFDSESYVIRNSLVEVMGNIMIKIFANLDEIDDVDTRNNYFKTKEKFIDILFDRIYDKVGFCRGKVLATFERLCDANMISVPTYLRLLEETSGRLKDEKSIVRKRAISLISKIITAYAMIFNTDRFFNYDELQSITLQSEKKISELENELKLIENSDNVDEESKTQINQDINKENLKISFYKDYKMVLKTIDKVVPLISQLLCSKNVSDVQESIDLFIVLHKLRVASSIQGVKKMLTLIMKPEISIKKKVMEAYSKLYFTNTPDDIQAAYLVGLTVSLNFGEITCLRELLKSLIETKEIRSEMFKEVWKIMLKDPDNESALGRIKATNEEELLSKQQQMRIESVCALQIINIVSDYESSILLNNADLYIKNIFNHLLKEKVNWMVIKESFIGLQKIYPLKKDITEHCLVKIAKIVVQHYGKDDKSNMWFIVVKEMIDTIFQLLPHPEKIAEYLIRKLTKPFYMDANDQLNDETHSKFMTQNIMTQQMEIDSDMNTRTQHCGSNDGVSVSITPLKVAQLIFVIGHIGLNMVIYSEKLEGMLKKKGEESKKRKSNASTLSVTKDDINEIGGGKEAEIERDIEILHSLIEKRILNEGLLSKYIPLIQSIAKQSLQCSHSELNSNLLLYKSAILALCKLMNINSSFCEQNIPFMFDILSSETIHDSLKLNVCAAFGDFINRFPNLMQGVISKFFTCLHSKSRQVRRYAMIVISHLVLGDMLKLKGEVVDICMLFDSDDDKLKELVSIFFHEINNKGNNVIYNIIPKALAKLSGEYKSISYSQFQSIVRTLMKYVEKDKHTEGLIDKLFVKLRNSTDVIEWRNTTYCFTLLNYSNEKLVTKFIEMYGDIKDKKDDDEVVKSNVEEIFAKFKKVANVSASTKMMVDTAERKFMNGERFVVVKTEVKDTKRRVAKRMFKDVKKEGSSQRSDDNEKGSNLSEESGMEVEEEKGRSKRRVSKKGRKGKIKGKRGRKRKTRSGEESDEEEDDNMSISEYDDEDEDE